MIQAKYDWKLADVDDEMSADFLKLTKQYNLDELTAKIFWQRDIREVDDLEDFLKPDLSNLHDPFLLHDMEKAVHRIMQAIENGENILIYGDYDADGMTAASVMKTALDELGAEPRVYLPNRFTDGYGPNRDVYEYFIKNEEINLIITVDNGVAGNEAIEFAQENNVDVIVTDHHSMPQILPNAFAIVHPEHPESQYPFPYLAGVGVAFKVACALLEYTPVEMLDLVAIGTIADMVSLTDENRILVKNGLQILQNTERTGLVELLKLAGQENQTVTEETVGFQLAPRLNSLGRLDDPNPAIELLTGWDDDEVAQIAQEIDEMNTQRRTIVDEIFIQAHEMLTGDEVEILYHSDWHKGVLGIVAGRLLEEIHKPVILLAEEDGILRGSARSVESFDIFKALDNHRDLFVAFGGHKQAAGMTLTVENVVAVKQVMIEFIAENQIDMNQKTTLNLTASVKFDQVNLETIKNLSKLAPFGMDFPKPKFLLEDFDIAQARSMGKDNSHLKLKLKQGEQQLDAVYFGHGSEAQEFLQNEIQLVGSLSSNTWNGQTSVQLMVEDAAVSGIELLDARNGQIDLPSNLTIFDENQLKNDIMEEVLFVKSAPSTDEGLSNLAGLIQSHDFKLVIFKNEMAKNYYLTGAGSRAEFAKLYKAIYQYPEFDVRYKLKNLANFLKIPEILLIKMIQIFEELEFVTISDGVMTVNKSAEKREISSSTIYQELERTVKMQEFFALSSVRDIYRKLKGEN